MTTSKRLAIPYTRGESLAHGPSDGAADSLNEAKAAFRAAWERRP